MKLTLPMPPSANVYWRYNKGKVHVSSEAKQYKTLVGWLVLEAGIREPTLVDVVVTIHVYRERKAGDLDNRIKILLDSLRGIVYRDDSQVTEIHAYRHDDKHAPRVEVEFAYG
jgi:crossover junction endodeoxyribonuclease RusA